MKRPEGFDRGTASLPPARSRRTSPAPVRPAREVPPVAAPDDPRGSRASGPASPHPTRQAERRSRARLRAAERSRRRTERAEVRRFTRRSRNRRTAAIVSSVVIGGLIGVVALAVFSPILALRTIRVDGTARLDPAQLERAVDGQIGTPLALLDVERMTEELSRFPLIRNYSTEIVPPDTLLVHVVERTPVAVVPRGSGFELVDPAGVLIERADDRPPGVPLIDLADSGDVGGPVFRSMAEVVLALPAPLLAQVDTVSARTRDDVTLTLIGGSQRVVWGPATDSDRKAQVLQALLAARGNAPGEYDVSAPGNGVFRAG